MIDSEKQLSQEQLTATEIPALERSHPQMPSVIEDPDEKAEEVDAPHLGAEQVLHSESQPEGRTREQVIRGRIQFATLCLPLFLGGWNDGTTGALLPRIQDVYDVNFTVLSLIFLFACFGFMSGSVISMYLTDWIGFGKTLVVGSLLQMSAYCIQAPGPPYPVFVLGYVISGMGFAIQDAQANGFVANIKSNASTKMGGIHACYGLGLFVAPLVSTQFATLPRWSFHYLVSLGIALVNTVLLAVVFRFKAQDSCLVLSGEKPPERATQDEGSLFRQVMRSREAHILAFFIIAHLGVGVTVSGWIVTYIIDVRGGGPSSGYISAGVSGGVMVGRIGLVWVNNRIGERNAIFIYSFICIGLEFVIWFVPSLVGNAVAACFIGFLLGPMYPMAVNQAKRILPGRMLTGAIGWMAGFGQTGSALLPFMTGAIASKHGLKTMPPVLVGMSAVMVFVWALVPTKPRQS